MEKEQLWDLKWQPSEAKLPPEGHSSSSAGSQLPQCIPNLNWRQPMANNAEFESALSSFVSSPSSNPPASIGELVGRVGSSICNAGEISPSSRHCIGNSSCYSTPPNSPPRLDLSAMEHREQGGGRGGFPVPVNRMPGAAAHLGPFLAELRFADGAGRLSCFGERSSGGLAAQFGLLETGNFSRVSRSHSGIGFRMGIPNELDVEMRSKFRESSTPAESELGNGQEESSLSDRMTAEASSMRGISITDSNAGKTKAAAKRKGKEAPLSSSATNLPANLAEENPDAKRFKPPDRNGSRKNKAMKTKAEKDGDSGQEQAKDDDDNDAKPPEPLKDYIHVRARRGQATDAHSLAERVRREKISKRMKFLQDLVPGCNKITGKAVMLDEIINYVQSLQRQVEFLSMKLSTLNPQLDLNMETLLSKEMYQACGPIPAYPAETMSTMLSYAHQPQSTTFSFNPLDAFLRQSQGFHLAPADVYADATSQIGNFWENDLQSAAQIGFDQNLDMTATAFSPPIVHGQVNTNQMKIEP